MRMREALIKHVFVTNLSLSKVYARIHFIDNIFMNFYALVDGTWPICG